MFPTRFYPDRFYPGRYYPHGVSAPAGPGGGYYPGRYYPGRYFPARYYPITGASIVILYYDAMEAVQAFFTGRSDLTSAVPRIWLVEAPEKTVYPFVEYFLVSELDVAVPTRNAGWKLVETIVQISCHQPTPQASADLSRKFEAAFDLADFSIQGLPILHCQASSPTTGKGEGKGPKGQDSWMSTIDLEILWTRPRPVLTRN
jgi:hypothetical protein